MTDRRGRPVTSGRRARLLFENGAEVFRMLEARLLRNDARWKIRRRQELTRALQLHP